MNKTMTVGVVILAIIVVAAGAYLLVKGGTNQKAANTSSYSTTQPATASTTQQSTTTVAEVNNSNATEAYTVGIAYNATVGNYLVNATGWTVYLYTPDAPYSGKSTCYSTCATYWPPVSYTANSLVLPPTLNASNFNTIARTDGTDQLTYKGYPLYYYLGDRSAGSVKGQGVGKIWYVLNVPKLIIPNSSSGT